MERQQQQQQQKDSEKQFANGGCCGPQPDIRRHRSFGM